MTWLLGVFLAAQFTLLIYLRAGIGFASAVVLITLLYGIGFNQLCSRLPK